MWKKKGASIRLTAVCLVSGERIPVWVGNFVLMGYGTGAIMAVPAHDERYPNCKKYGINIRPVIRPVDGALADTATMTEAFGDCFGRCRPQASTPACRAPWAQSSWQPVQRMKISANPQSRSASRTGAFYGKRCWGTPLPVIHCPTCGVVPVPDDQLPVLLPQQIQITGTGRSPLDEVPEFVNVKCPKCGEPARRETDTMDTFVDSSWYFYRYRDPKNLNVRPIREEGRILVSIDHHISAAWNMRFSTLIYSRFWTKVMRDIGLTKYDGAGEEAFHARHGDSQWVQKRCRNRLAT